MSPSTIGPDPAVLPSLPSSANSSSHNMPYYKRPSVGVLHSSSSTDLESKTQSHRSSSSSSSTSIAFSSNGVVPVSEEGIIHVDEKLEARRYKSDPFSKALLRTLLAIRIPSWTLIPSHVIKPQSIKIYKVSGSLTNAVFFVSYPDIPAMETVLLRIYGPSSSELISRPKELHTLHVLSSKYRIGPRVYGTFANGRVEEYFNSTALTSYEMRDPKISRWIGARMAELHRVDCEETENGTFSGHYNSGKQIISVQRNVRTWLRYAQDVLKLEGVLEKQRKQLDIDKFVTEWENYWSWLSSWEAEHGASARVFAHNDAQYGNLLKLNNGKELAYPHRQIIVVDFEYAGSNPAAYDIANHFHEWTADYHGTTPHLLDHSKYPNESQRRNFHAAYIMQKYSLTSLENTRFSLTDIDSEMSTLEEQVRVWSPASHANWALWGIIQARESLLSGSDGSEDSQFDYLGYAICRMIAFRRELKALTLS